MWRRLLSGHRPPALRAAHRSHVPSSGEDRNPYGSRDFRCAVNKRRGTVTPPCGAGTRVSFPGHQDALTTREWHQRERQCAHLLCEPGGHRVCRRPVLQLRVCFQRRVDSLLKHDPRIIKIYNPCWHRRTATRLACAQSRSSALPTSGWAAIRSLCPHENKGRVLILAFCPFSSLNFGNMVIVVVSTVTPRLFQFAQQWNKEAGRLGCEEPSLFSAPDMCRDSRDEHTLLTLEVHNSGGPFSDPEHRSFHVRLLYSPWPQGPHRQDRLQGQHTCRVGPARPASCPREGDPCW